MKWLKENWKTVGAICLFIYAAVSLIGGGASALNTWSDKLITQATIGDVIMMVFIASILTSNDKE